ncbi:MAG: putative cobalamin binding protein [Bacteroidetes bacterium]|nr:putative cobalamin binding protein [Bacteroidota bacterium]
MTTLSTEQVAQLLDVTVSTIKRWADEGMIACIKTPGGHRKFELAEVTRFAEGHGMRLSGGTPPPLSGEQLEQLQFGIHAQNYHRVSDLLLEEALQGDREGLYQLLLYVTKHHIRFATIADEIIRPALVRIGERWHQGSLEISDEHRASGVITEALIRLAPDLHRKASNGLTAVCACAEGEQHEIGLRCMAYALELEGWKVHFVGANTPYETLASFTKAAKPNLLCISLSLTRHRKELLDGMALVARAVRSSGAKIVAGGFRADTFSMAELRCDHIATTIEDGVAYVRSAFGLKPGPKTKPPTASQQ